MTEEPLALVAHELAVDTGFSLVPAPAARDWMSATPKRFAKRCLPLLLANQAGWLVLNNARVRCCWNGGDSSEVRIDYEGPTPRYPAVSHFGEGIVTWSLPYLFRTPPGYDLLARGPANLVKDGACPLEGLVETDWTPATFTMNWKLTRPGAWVTFARDEPLCMLVPQRRGELEQWRPRIEPLRQDPELQESHATWTASRAQFLAELVTNGSDADRAGWQKDYFRGRTPDGQEVRGHQNRLRLRSFSRYDRPGGA